MKTYFGHDSTTEKDLFEYLISNNLIMLYPRRCKYCQYQCELGAKSVSSFEGKLK